MCEHFIARAAEPFRLDDLWPFTERLERFGIAGFGWGAAWLEADGRLASHRDVRAFRDDPARDGVGTHETTAALIHLRRPSRLSTLTYADTQPFDDPARRFAFSHNGDLRNYKGLRDAYRRQGRIHGRADTEVGERWLEDAWTACPSNTTTTSGGSGSSSQSARRSSRSTASSLAPAPLHDRSR